MDGSKPLRLGVVGVGYVGRHHARLLASMPGVELVGVADINRSRADEVAQSVGTRGLPRAEDLLDGLDAVTVAVPTESHLAVARPFLDRGIAVLVEKPIASSLDEADDLIASAARTGALLAVGHTERYNPAYDAARPHLTTPRFVEAHRLGTFPDRSLDIDVVLDVMVHDLDIILDVLNADVEEIDAVGVAVLTERVDIANARLRFTNGCIANLTASRISRDRVRKIRFFQPDAYVSIDCGNQECEVWRLVRQAGAAPAIQGGKLSVISDEPLRLELANFVEAVAGRPSRVVPAAEGRRVLTIAQRIVAAMERGVEWPIAT